MNSNIPEIKNPLVHSGTNRFMRLATEMTFDYVQIEERHEQDFLNYAAKLTSAIQYYDQNDQPAGNWTSFFDENVASDRPHKALFIAFLRLLEALNEHANGLTKRHLDFYYREVLHFVEREAKPSQVHLFFTCAKSLKERFIENETEFLAGENKDGKKILYRLIDELVVNQGRIVHFFSIYKHNDAFKNRLFAADYSKFLAFEESENQTGFPAFGEHQLTDVKDDQGGYTLAYRSDFTMEEAHIGFAFSSALLRMAEGEREIHLKLDLADFDKLTFDKNQFYFSITIDNGWHTLHATDVIFSTNEIAFKIELKNTDPAIKNYLTDEHGGAYSTDFPVMRVLLKYDTNYPYLDWKNVEIKNARLRVKAANVRSLILQNEQSVIDPSKPFRPFGPLPSIGSHFYIGHADIFNNKLANVKAIIRWKGLSHSNLSDTYSNYTYPVTNQSFRVNTAVLEDKVWKNELEQPLFAADAFASQVIHFVPIVERKFGNDGLKQWDYKTTHGFVRMTLAGPNSPNFQGFGHSVYPKDLMHVNSLNTGINPPNPRLEINQPYTPLIESLSLDYETKEVDFSDLDSDCFYHVTHYGQKKLALNHSLIKNKLFPEYNYEGEFYIGLEKLVLPQSISLLFQLIEGTADANQSTIKSGVQWHYLVGNEWKKLDVLRISKDTTRSLLNTGIIRFDLPQEMDDNHELMPDGLFWLKATIPAKSAGIDRILAVQIHAVEAEEVEPELQNEVIPPKTITKFKNGGRGIDTINQPFASFGGTNSDDEELFYARITERLRHKDRGVMIWDYERLVLDSFPELYKVKCLNHTNYKTEMVAGNVMVAVIPNLRRKGIHSPFQPKLSIHKRMEIYDYLRQRITPFIYLRVENPIYEPIQLSFNVGFHKGKDEGFYGKKLHKELQEFLSPWAFENELSAKSDLVFGGELHKSTVLKFIEDLDYVDFVNDFNMYHIYQDERVSARFSKKLADGNFQLNAANNFIYHHEDGPCNRFLFKFNVEDSNEPTLFFELSIRFLKGLIELENDTISEKFTRELLGNLKRRSVADQPITKNLLRILIKNMYYVDKLVSLDFYKELPNNYVMEDVDVAVAKTSRSIMVTSEQHRIGVYRAGDYNCEGSVVIGIGFMIVEADFIVPQIKQENYEYNTRDY